MRFDFTSEDPILLGEINDKVNVLKELVRLRFEASEEMQKGGIMQIKGVICKRLTFNIFSAWSSWNR